MARTFESPARPGTTTWLREVGPPLAVLLFLLILPFLIALLDGQSPAAVLSNQTGTARFMQGLLLEIFILAIYALSYDLILGVTGLLSFGHAMFFATGAYATGIMLKSFGWDFPPTVGVVVVVGVLQALLFAVAARVQGITFALVTLGDRLGLPYRRAVQRDGGLHGRRRRPAGVPVPDFRTPDGPLPFLRPGSAASHFLVYVVYRRFVNSPTGGSVWLSGKTKGGRSCSATTPSTSSWRR